jgi:malonate decarboxylase gamma subunit
MTLDEILRSLFPTGHDVQVSADGLIGGSGTCRGQLVAVVGVGHGVALGAGAVLPLAERVLDVIACGGHTPILVLVDTQGQLMSRREEMLGLNEYLAHLAKCLLLASLEGHRTIGLEYGKAAAGAFLATALATDALFALPIASPTVMDLPSMARVTKLPLQTLEELSRTTSVFAPGLPHMVRMGAVAQVWDPARPLDAQLETALVAAPAEDLRDERGDERGGRPMAAKVARRVLAEAAGRRA